MEKDDDKKSSINKEKAENLSYTYISLISDKIKVGIIGAGKAGVLKTKHFLKDGCRVEVLSKEFSEEILNLNEEYKNLKLVKDLDSVEFIKDKNIIVYAADDAKEKEKAGRFAIENCRIFVDSTEFKQGNAVVPVTRETKTMKFALNTKEGNPKGAVFAAETFKREAEKMDPYIEYTASIRNSLRNSPDKKEILNHIFSEEFRKEFYHM